MPGRRARLALAAALILAAPGLIASGPAQADTIPADVSASSFGQSMPSGFLGTSLEYRAVHQYTGRDPNAVDPVLVALLRGLVPGQAPVIRIGGDSSDGTWWPMPGVLPRGGIYYRLTEGWLRTTHALAAALGAKLILGINLEVGRPAIAAAEARALEAGIGRRYISSLEIGNEPDLYGVFPWYVDRRGRPHFARGRHYNLAGYTREFTRWSHALPRLPLAGPATSGPAWMAHLGRFIAAEPRLKLVTYHRYPLRSCLTNPADTSYPSITNLLADRASSGLARGVAGYVRVAHAHHRALRLTELNSASCEGTAGVSDSFASALWALDTLFNLADVGVVGVNFHMLPGSHYELFSTSRTPWGAWQAAVHPEYYGLLMFGQAFPPGARLLRVSAPGGPVKVWSTQDRAGTIRITLINKDPNNAHEVHVGLPGPPRGASVERLLAPSVGSTNGETLGGQSFGPETTTGTLPGSPHTTSVAPAPGGGYDVALPAASAALITVGP